MSDRSILECFEEVRCRNPEARAVITQSGHWSYNDLDQFANQLAQSLLGELNPSDQSVILLMGRDPLVIVGLLAILKTGKLCIPLHPSNHEARILGSVLDDHSSPLILTNSDGEAFLKKTRRQARIINLETLSRDASVDPPSISINQSDPSFVIYTSGSTGFPKGVIHTQRAIVSRIAWYQGTFNINESDTTLMLSTADSISGIIGMFRPLLTGGRLIVFSIRRQGFDAMTRIIKDHKVTLLPMVNSVFRHFVNSLPKDYCLESVRLIILGGEAMTSGDVDRYRTYFSTDCLLLNTLGCTEIPTYRFFEVNQNYPNEAKIVPAGHAVPGNEVLIIDDQGKSLEPGELGEIAVKTDQLALGYWSREEETRARFFVSEDGTSCYRTGDLGIMQPDGLLQFMGREDNQVKILGNRVEVAEIENVLEKHPQIRSAAVGVLGDSDEKKELYANLVFEDATPPCDRHELIPFLSKSLPDYMVPLHFISVPALPFTRTGKIDHKALVKPDNETRDSNLPEDSEERTAQEQRVADICSEVLQVDHIGIHQNLLNYGANSLLMMQIVNRIQREFVIRIPFAILFNNATVAEIGRFLREHRDEETKS